MQALVLAGGEGTRLRPLTLTTPKPVMPLAGRPFLTFMLSWLARHGVDDAIMSCGHLSDEVERVLGDEYEGVRLHHVVEEERLDTAGPVRLAYDQGLLQERFFVMNGDCLADLDLSAELRQHEATGAVATLGLVEVDDTSHYGVVPTHADGQVEAFLEKQPGPVRTNRINAGAYILERSVVESHIPAGRPVSFEREVFQQLVGNGLYGWHAEGYWIDIGTPERYLEATYDLLAGRVESTLPARDETDSLIPETCITIGARIGPLSVLGQHCSVGDRAFVERSVLHDSVIVGAEAHIQESVIAAGARIGEGARLGPDAIVGAGAEIAPGAVVGEGVRVEPAEKVA
ncbi:MAG: mannose-phosphate guanylyltransferase [Thermoleophilales bacterium]|nr:mannose-phosphate guanylyltransferase [Thermoleophilales bacterium]